nr:YeeE/YedE thiosulfate transporter family protein [Kordiimonas marina]
MATTGRIAGISGMIEGLLDPKAGESAWKLAFLIGLLLAPTLFRLVTGGVPEIGFPHSLGLMVAGGLLVGFGTRVGGGCTSGHGVCGIARMSRRSIVSTLTFMATGILTVYVVGLVGGGQ